MKALIKEVELVEVATFIQKAPEGRDSETWKVTLRGKNKLGWLKLSDDKFQIVAEVIAAKIGKAMGLPIPSPKITTIKKSQTSTIIPKESKWHNHPEDIPAFISMNVASNPISFQRLRNINSYDEKQKWKGHNNALIFDEWLANTDRNLGNILYNPKDKSYWLIDHGRALTGEYRPLWGLDNYKVKVNNELLTTWFNKENIVAQRKLIKEAHSLLQASSNLNIADINADNSLDLTGENIDINAIIDFISKRIFITPDLLCQKLNLKQSEMKLTD